MTETPNLPNEIDRRIRAECMGFRRYTRELHDRLKASQDPDGEVRGSRGSLIRMRDMDSSEGPLHQAAYNTS